VAWVQRVVPEHGLNNNSCKQCACQERKPNLQNFKEQVSLESRVQVTSGAHLNNNLL